MAGSYLAPLIILKSQLSSRAITEAEYQTKRLQIIDSLTGTVWQPPPIPSASAAPAKKTGEAPRTWQIFYHASNNNVPGLEECLEAGVDINIKDHDSGNTALMMASNTGQKHAIFFLVEQGADVNVQNNRGDTALHLLVQNKFSNLAVWLAKHGADIHLENSRSFSPYDMALPWLQTELREAESQRTLLARAAAQANVTPALQLAATKAVVGQAPGQHPVHSPLLHPPVGLPAPGLHLPPGSISAQMGTSPHSGLSGLVPQASGGIDKNLDAYYSPSGTSAPTISAVPIESMPMATGETGAPEVMRVFLKNRAYKSVMIKPDSCAGDVCAMMAEKIGMAEFANALELVDCVKTTERRLDPAQNVFRIKRAWPLILGTGGNETEDFCKFIVVPKRGCSEAAQARYRAAMYGK